MTILWEKNRQAIAAHSRESWEQLGENLEVLRHLILNRPNRLKHETSFIPSLCKTLNLSKLVNRTRILGRISILLNREQLLFYFINLKRK